MATQLPTVQQGSGMQNIQGILQLLTGAKSKTTTSGGDTTQQTQLTPEALTHLLNTLMSSNQGLAKVASGEKSAGLYNSSVNTQLINDLLSKTSGEVAVRAAPTVTTRTPTVQTQQIPGILGNVNPLLAIAGMQLAGPLLSNVFGSGGDKTSKAGTKAVGGAIESIMFPGGKKKTDSSFLDILSGGTSGGAFMPSIAGATVSGVEDVVGGGFSGSIFGDLGNVVGNIGDIGSSAGSVFGDIGLDLGGGIPGLGGIFGSIDIPESGSDLASNVAQAGTSLALSTIPVIGPPLAIINTIFGGDLFDDLFDGISIICTELHKQGRMSRKTYVAGMRHFQQYSDLGKSGYYFWAAPIVAHLRKHPASKFSVLVEIIFNARGKHISGEHKSFVASLINPVMVGVSYTVGFFLSLRNEARYATK